MTQCVVAIFPRSPTTKGEGAVEEAEVAGGAAGDGDGDDGIERISRYGGALGRV